MSLGTKTPTSAEVARLAGVSRTTVSFVLNDVRDQGISEVTRARVLAAAHDLGYTPNAAARTLAGAATGTVGVVIPKAEHLYVDVFLAQLVASVNQECHRLGFKLLIESNEGMPAQSGGFVDLVRSRRIDGLLVVNLRRADHGLLHRMVHEGIPMVVLGCGVPGEHGFHTVGNDTRASGLALASHLTGLGHRRIAFVNYAPPEYHSVNEREDGWRQALGRVGVEADPAWLEHADISAQSGYLATQRLLARRTGCTAIFAGNDTIAFGALKALQEAGLRVPQDMALAGFDDIPLAAFAQPALTTMRTDAVGHGREAMAMLAALMRGEQGVLAHVDCAAELVVRASCGARPAG